MTTQTDDWIEIRVAPGDVLGWLPTEVARGLGVNVTERKTAITAEERKLMQVHPDFVPARAGMAWLRGPTARAQ